MNVSLECMKSRSYKINDTIWGHDIYFFVILFYPQQLKFTKKRPPKTEIIAGSSLFGGHNEDAKLLASPPAMRPVSLYIQDHHTPCKLIIDDQPRSPTQENEILEINIRNICR